MFHLLVKRTRVKVMPAQPAPMSLSDAMGSGFRRNDASIFAETIH
jgi:hypothetical protein